MKKQKGVQYTVSKTENGITYKSKVYFDGSVYRWVSNDRVPPADAVREYGIDQLPSFWPGEHQLMREADLFLFLRAMGMVEKKEQPKKKRITIKEQARQQIEVARRAVMARVEHLESHPMGHAFLWGVVEVVLKNGKTRKYRACFGGVCIANLPEACRLANQIPGVSNVSYNLD